MKSNQTMKKIGKGSMLVLLGSLFYLSCSDHIVIDIFQQAINGPQATVKLEIDSRFKNADNTTRSTAPDVNEGSTLQPIQNAIIAAYIGNGTARFDLQNRAYNTVEIGTIDLNGGKTISDPMEVPVTAVNFLFYGNGTAGNWSGPQSMNQGKYLSDISFNLENGSRPILNTLPREYYKQPAALFYWSGTPNIEIDKQQTPPQVVTLTPAHYGVGNLVSVVRDQTSDEGQLTLTGVFVGNQPLTVDWQFEPVDYANNKVVIYDGAINANSNGAAAYLPRTFPDTLTAATVSDYTLVFPTPAYQDIPVSLVVTSTQAVTLNNGFTAAAGTEIHLPAVTIKAVLATNTGYQVFKSDYRTILRLTIHTIKNGDIVPQPLVTADVSLDLTINTEWEEGTTLDYDIL